MSRTPADNSRFHRRSFKFGRLFLLAALVNARSAPAAPTLPMMLDPALEQPAPEVTFDRRNVTLWLAALRRPEFDLRVAAIEAFSTAHRQGVKDLTEAIPPIKNLLQTDPHPAVRLAAARALIEFDIQVSAASLQAAVADISKVPPGFVLAVDAALARWNHPDARAMWIARLGLSPARPAVAVSAIQSLAAVHAIEAAEALEKCLRDRSHPICVRLEAARALHGIDAPGLSPLAGSLATEPEPSGWGPLLALVVLGADVDSPGAPKLDAAAIALTDSLTSSPDARIRAKALSLLRRADPSRALSKVSLVRDSDDEVRLEAVRTLAAAPAEPRAVAPLAGALDDISEPVRVAARLGLLRLGHEPPTSASVIQATTHALSSGRWRESEQAAILAGDLRTPDAAAHLAALLDSARPEVRLAAATSLRTLHLPESLPALMKRAGTLTDSAREAAKDQARFESDGQEVTQIFIAFAQQRYRPAAELLRKYVPKRSGFHPTARGSAIYALGRIFESQSIPDLAAQLLERAADNNPLDPEAADVRRFSAIALGRMGAREALPTLRELYEAENSTVSVGGACRWAIIKIEGVNLPPCRPITAKAGPFFIESIQPEPTPVSP